MSLKVYELKITYNFFNFWRLPNFYLLILCKITIKTIHKQATYVTIREKKMFC